MIMYLNCSFHINVLTLVLILVPNSTFCKNDYNFRTSFQQLLANANYRVVSYTVQTSDRYLITVDRIVPNGTYVNSTYNANRKPILLISGIQGTSAQFFINAPEPDGGSSCGENFGFCLLKTNRYDVWSLNVRGNGISAAHMDKDVYDDSFWKFSFDEIGRFDVPAAIDLILGETERSRLAVVGYSYGTVSSLALLSLDPSWASKIHPLVLWGPVPYMAHMKSFVTPFIPLAKYFLPQSVPMQNPASMNPNLYTGQIFKRLGSVWGVIQQLYHGRTTHFNNTRWSYYMRFCPSGASYSDNLHLSQLYLSKNFTRFDFGKSENLKKYGSEEAPIYPLWRIPKGFNLFIAYGNTDAFVQLVDVKRLISDLKGWGIDVEEFNIPSSTWNHFNYIAGTGATELINRPTLKYLDSFY